MSTTDIQHHDELQASASMMNGPIFSNNRILNALRASRIVDNLCESEINILAEIIDVQHLEAKEYIVKLNDYPLKDALMILIEGVIEISAMVNNEPVSLHLESPGDLARVISFMGDANINISARMNVKKNSEVILLHRSKLETLLHSHAHPSIVYCVLRNLVLHVHGLARRMNVENKEMANYVYRTHGLY